MLFSNVAAKSVEAKSVEFSGNESDGVDASASKESVSVTVNVNSMEGTTIRERREGEIQRGSTNFAQIKTLEKRSGVWRDAS